ncbi:Uma2 family endonuclease [Thermostichus vulcanus]|uniref:Uma2 family endonuclease n=1 Tax=Thermostichus vulcanus str. 'Rupite' TaxID=2813851 RepID=A0ABT0C9V9_THEVL|nr:Uma2 family endonuclease [Thermostichus vulcanus]MCJ2542567.1 Uma2 family endonuclease [Thermostichus vulcanus str. 'Rupite']
MATYATPEMASTERSPLLGEERVVLNDISWQTFERLLTEAGEGRNTRFHYWQGRLEIMSPLAPHEGSNRFLESLIVVIAEEWNLNLRQLGSWTMRRSDLQMGAEPDSCYYIQHEPLIRHKEEIDLAVDPPPDLVLEIDITHPSKRRLPIYAKLGVPEVWTYNGRTVQYFQRQDDTYLPIAQSLSFPSLPASILQEFLEKRYGIGEIEAIRQFREWARQQIR